MTTVTTTTATNLGVRVQPRVAIPDVNLDASTATFKNGSIGFGRAPGRQLVTLEICIVRTVDVVVCDWPRKIFRVLLNRPDSIKAKSRLPHFEKLSLDEPRLVAKLAHDVAIVAGAGLALDVAQKTGKLVSRQNRLVVAEVKVDTVQLLSYGDAQPHVIAVY